MSLGQPVLHNEPIKEEGKKEKKYRYNYPVSTSSISIHTLVYTWICSHPYTHTHTEVQDTMAGTVSIRVKFVIRRARATPIFHLKHGLIWPNINEDP